MTFGGKSHDTVRLYSKESRLRLEGEGSLPRMWTNEEEAELTSVGPRKERQRHREWEWLLTAQKESCRV